VTLPGIIEVFSNEATDVENTTTSPASTTKFIKDGALYIQMKGNVFDVLGNVVDVD
jgi:hypothetical protein